MFLLRLGCEVSGPLSVGKADFVALVLALRDMFVEDALGTTHHGGLVRDTLELLILKLLCDGVLAVVGLIFRLILLVLFLDHLHLVVDGAAGQLRVQLLEQVVGGVGSAVHDGVPVLDSDVVVQLLKELRQVIPIADLFVELKAVVKLIHFDFIGVVSVENFRIQPPI